MFPDEMAQPGSLSSRDEKKFDSVFVSHGPNHPNLRDKDRMGCLGDCQIEISGASHWQHQCAAEVTLALGQVISDLIGRWVVARLCVLRRAASACSVSRQST